MKYIVIDLNDPNFTYIVEDLMGLIIDIYSVELSDPNNTLKTVLPWFYQNYKVLCIEGDNVLVKEITND